tara:strand:+ start:4688 stop:6046 length:1359 start_codon:yes stop_codon:yes gene_type:complete
MENSKICLHSLSFQPIQNVIIIDAINNTLTYNLTNTTPANQKVIQLEPQVYTNINFQELLDDMTLKLNNSLTLQGKNIGAQFECFIGEKTKKAEVGYKYSVLKNDDFFDSANTTRTTTTIKRADNTFSANDVSRLTSEHPFINGCGVFRVRLRNIGDNGSGSSTDNGFTIGLSEEQPDKMGNVISTKFGIKVGRYTDPYESIVTDTKTVHTGLLPENFVDTTQANNDVMEISISEGKIRGRIYRNTPTVPTLLFEEDLDRTKQYFPYLSFQGGGDTSQANTLRYNYNPALYSDTQIENVLDIYSGFQADPPGVPRNTNTILKVEFPLVLSEFLGFKQPIQIKSGTSVNLVADTLFTATLINDSFLVEMKNIDLESYDGFGSNGVRRNILAIVPKSDNSGIVEYEPNTPYFIDMKNPEKTLRNIRARLLRSDLEPVQISGLAVLTILIKSPNE